MFTGFSRPEGLPNQGSDWNRRSSGSGHQGPAGGSGGQPLTPSTTTTAPASAIPINLSFIFKIKPLRPDYQIQSRRINETGAWAPPNIKTAYASGPGSYWRWVGGKVTSIATYPAFKSSLRELESATLFSQFPDTPHLLVVPFDARTENVKDYGRGWLPITFDHERRRIFPSGVREYYSSISAAGDQDCIAAHGNLDWMPQLLNRWYEYRPTANSQPRLNAGLIGSLPLLLALAFFSAPAANLPEAMRSLQPGFWQSHNHDYPSGHTIGERGVVVSIFLDPGNPQYSTKDLLEKLEEGQFGPFYG